MPPRRTENRACRPKGPNLPRPRRTERATSARRRSCRVWGGAPPRKPSLQASKLPSFQLPLHPRHVCDVPKDAGQARRRWAGGSDQRAVARKATGVSPSGFARTRVFAGKRNSPLAQWLARRAFTRAPFTVHCSLFSVLWGALAPLPFSRAASPPFCYTVGKEFGHGRREDCARDL